MNRTSTPEWQTQIKVAREQAVQQWQALGEREKLGLQAAAAVLAALLFWSLALAPALRTLRTAPAQIEALDLQLQRMQAQAAEAKSLKAAPPVSTAQAQAALTSASERLGAQARLALTGDRAVLTLNGVASEALQAWLGEVRAAGRARPVEAQLTRGPQGFSGSIVLVLGGVGS